VVVAKLDRLSPDVAFVTELGADADSFMIQIYAALDEKRGQ
jgi:hypothetical protein